ncbi:MAG: tyrosine-type recombinase/integrase [Clostridia bacterium]|nr:tyrosine-type recombinase/integrase [Clostridia bacterium]
MQQFTITKQNVFNFKTWLLENERSELTVEKYIRDVNFFISFLSGNSLTKQSLIDFKKRLIESYKPASVNSMIASVNSFLRFSNLNSMCLKQLKIQRKIYVSEDKELTKAEFLRLVDTANREKNERLSLIIQTICATGIRVSELKFITVEGVKSGETTVDLKGKRRVVFIVPKLRNKLLAYIQKKGIKYGAVFVTKSGAPVSRSNVWREMKALCEESGVNKNKVFPHNLRHLFARTFYGIEKDIVRLADILGHSSVNTTRIYVMTTSKEHSKQMQNMRLII